jgi:uncharacterized protein DUF4304
MSQSPVVAGLNAIQSGIGKALEPLGFTRKGRTFRRETDEGVLQIIAIQAGPFEIGPPLPPPVSHMRPDYYGKFTINLGVFVPEIHERTNPPITMNRVISDAHCSIRTRLGHVSEGRDVWWPVLGSSEEEIEDIIALMIHVGVAFLDRFRTRDLIERDWIAFNDSEESLSNVARLDVAMILLARDEAERAKRLFKDHLQFCEADDSKPHLKHHAAYVRELAVKLGLGELG